MTGTAAGTSVFSQEAFRSKLSHVRGTGLEFVPAKSGVGPIGHRRGQN
jgi:hypothetical protein